MGALPFQGLRISLDLRKPERRAIVMGRRESKALGLEAKAARCRGRAPGLDGARFIARPNQLAGAPGASLAAQRESVNPFAVLVGDVFEAPVGAHGDDAPIVTARKQRLPVAGRRQYRGVGMSDDALLRVGLTDQHDAVGERQSRRAIEKRRRHNVRARVEQSRVPGQRRSRALRFGHGLPSSADRLNCLLSK